MRLAVYAGSLEECEVLAGYAVDYLGGDTSADLFGRHVELLAALQRTRYDLLFVALNGTFSQEVVEAARESVPDLPLVWLSDLDFAVRSYRLRVDYFLLKPVGRAELYTTMARIGLHPRANAQNIEAMGE